jgi:hypothetical protein
MVKRQCFQNIKMFMCHFKHINRIALDMNSVKFSERQPEFQLADGLMKIAIYFSEKLILFLFRPPPPPNPLPQGEGGLSLP